MTRSLTLLAAWIAAAGPAFATPLVLLPAESSVAVDVRASPPHRFTCDLIKYNAQIEIDPASGTVQSATFSFALTDLETHNDSRNQKLYKWMDVDNHNQIRWTLDSVEVADGRSIGHGGLWMHGVTAPVDVPFTLTAEDGLYTLAGTADFNYIDFLLPKIRLAIFTVKPALHVHFMLRGTLPPAK
jgi:polyisoprenoid-binding protein YceI